MTSGRRAVSVRKMKTGWQFSVPNHAGIKHINLIYTLSTRNYRFSKRNISIIQTSTNIFMFIIQTRRNRIYLKTQILHDSCLTTGCVRRVTLAQVNQGPALHHSQTYPYLTALRRGQPPRQHPAFLLVRTFWNLNLPSSQSQ